MTTKIIIPGNPIAKKRPRFTRRGNHVHTYSTQMSEESKIMWLIQNQFKGEPICVPITVIFNFYMPIPQSLSKKVHENDPHIKKPDIDNLVKMYLDAMNQMVFKDDSLIYRTSAIKVYSVSPRTVILIED